MGAQIGIIRGEIDYRADGLQQGEVAELAGYILENWDELGDTLMVDGGYVLIHADRETVEQYITSYTGLSMDDTDEKITAYKLWMDRVFTDHNMVYLMVSH